MNAGLFDSLFDYSVTRHLRVMRPNLFELILCVLFPLIRPNFVFARGVLPDVYKRQVWRIAIPCAIN